MTDERVVWLATWILRIIGGSICLAFFPIFFPLPWMAMIHEMLGLGDIPAQPIFEYLSRSLSGMYFAHGCLVLVISTDVIAYRRFVWVLAGLNLFLGMVLLVTDLLAPMPLMWLLVEGPPIAAVGVLLLWLAAKIERIAAQRPSETESP